MHATRIEGRRGNCGYCDSGVGGIEVIQGAQEHYRKYGIFLQLC